MSILSEIKKLIFGYDIFLSYSRKDSLDYAYAIALYFMKKGYECYIDQLSSIMPGKDLPPNIKNAVIRSTAFVLIGTEGAQKSEPIENEIGLFLENNKNKPLIPITINNAINNNARWYEKIAGLALIDDTTENLKLGTPAQDILDRIEESLKFTKKSTYLRNISLTILLSVILISGLAALFAFSKTQEARKAVMEKEQAKSETKEAINQFNLATKLKTQADSLKNIALIEKDQAVTSMEQANEKSLNAIKLQKLAQTKALQANIEKDQAVTSMEQANENSLNAINLQELAQTKALQANLEAERASSEAKEQLKIAEENKKLAKKYETIGAARDLANEAKKEEENNPSTAVILASSAIQKFQADDEIDSKVESTFREIMSKQTGISLGTHSSNVETIAISPDEHLFASGDEDGVIKLWGIDSLNNYIKLYNLNCGGRVTDIQFTKDNKYIIANYLKKYNDSPLSTSFDICKVWEIEDYFTYPKVIYLNKGKLLGMSPDKSLIAILEDQSRINLFDVKAIKLNRAKRTFHSNTNNTLIKACFDKQNAILAVGTSKSQVLLWDLSDATNFPMRVIQTGHFDKTMVSEGGINVDIIKFSPDSKKLLTASTYWFSSGGNADVTIDIFDISNQSLNPVILKDASAIKDVFWSEHLISSVNIYGEIRSWDDKQFKQVGISNKKNSAEIDFINNPSITSDGKKLFFGGEKGNLYSFYVQDTGFIYDNSIKHLDAIRKLTLGNQGKLALFASRNDLKVIDIESGSAASSWTVGLDANRVRASKISNDYKTCMLIYPEKFSFWDLTNIYHPKLLGDVPFVANGFEQNCQAILSPDGNWAITQNLNMNKSTLYKLKGGLKKIKILDCRTSCWDFIFSHDSRYLITNEDRITWLYDFKKLVSDLPSRYKISDSSLDYHNFTFSPNDSWLAATSYKSKQDNSGSIWFLTDDFLNSKQYLIKGFEGKFNVGLTFSPNSNLLACNANKTYSYEEPNNYLLKFYTLSDSGNVVSETEYIQPDNPVNIAFSSKQKWMLTYSTDILLQNKRVNNRLWNISNGIDTNKIFTLPGSTKYLRTAIFSPDEKCLVAIQGYEQKWKLWNIDVTGAKLIKELKGPSSDLNNHWQAYFSPESDYLITYNESDYPTPFYFNLLKNTNDGIGIPLLNGNVKINSIKFSSSGDTLYIINSDYFGSNHTLKGKMGSAINVFTKDKMNEPPLVLIKSSDNNIHNFFTNNNFKNCITIGDKITYWDTDLKSLKSKAHQYAGRNLSWDEWLRMKSGQYEKVFTQLPIHSSVFYELLNQIVVAKNNGDTLFMQSKINELTDSLDNNTDPSLYNSLGWQLILIGKYHDAIKILNKSILLNPDEGLYRSTRGIAYSYLRIYDKAIDDFNFYIEWTNSFQGNHEYVIQRKRWIERMKQNQFPFTENDSPY